MSPILCPMKIGIKLNHDSHTPLKDQIAERIRRLIKTSRLSAGDVLPSVREAADNWGVNFTTVSRAYQELKAEGLISPNKSRRLEVCVTVKMSSERDRAKLLTPMIVGLKAQARELRVSDEALQAEIARALRWKDGWLGARKKKGDRSRP